jgi:hypothetical protein
MTIELPLFALVTKGIAMHKKWRVAPLISIVNSWRVTFPELMHRMAGHLLQGFFLPKISW